MDERKHTDLWQKLGDEDEIEHAASVSVEQAEVDLQAAGFDVAAERAKANAFLDALEGGAPASALAVAKIAPKAKSIVSRAADETPRARPRPAVAWLAAAAMVGAVAGGGLTVGFQALLQPAPVVMAHRPSGSAARVPSASDLAAAANLRRQAAAACDAKQWSVCLASLDKARAADLDGDDAPPVQSLREKAFAGIVETAGPGP